MIAGGVRINGVKYCCWTTHAGKIPNLKCGISTCQAIATYRVSCSKLAIVVGCTTYVTQILFYVAAYKDLFSAGGSVAPSDAVRIHLPGKRLLDGSSFQTEPLILDPTAIVLQSLWSDYAKNVRCSSGNSSQSARLIYCRFSVDFESDVSVHNLHHICRSIQTSVLLILLIPPHFRSVLSWTTLFFCGKNGKFSSLSALRG
jgi:hypothetical protein